MGLRAAFAAVLALGFSASSAWSDVSPYKDLEQRNPEVKDAFRAAPGTHLHSATRRLNALLSRGQVDHADFSVPGGIAFEDLGKGFAKSFRGDVQGLIDALEATDSKFLDDEAAGVDRSVERAVILQVLDFALLGRLLEIHGDRDDLPPCTPEQPCPADADGTLHLLATDTTALLGLWLDDVISEFNDRVITGGPYPGPGSDGLTLALLPARIESLASAFERAVGLPIIDGRAPRPSYVAFKDLLEDDVLLADAIEVAGGKNLRKEFEGVSRTLTAKAITSLPASGAFEELPARFAADFDAQATRLAAALVTAENRLAADEAAGDDRASERFILLQVLRAVAFDRVVDLNSNYPYACDSADPLVPCPIVAGSSPAAVVALQQRLVPQAREWFAAAIAFVNVRVVREGIPPYFGPGLTNLDARNFGDRLEELIVYGAIVPGLPEIQD